MFELVPRVAAAMVVAAVVPGALLVSADRAKPLDAGRMRIAWTSGSERGTASPIEIDVLLDAQGSWLAILRTGKQAGRRMLSVGDRLWLLLPGAKNPVPLSGQQRLSGLAAISDIAGMRLAHDFTATARAGTQERQGVACRVLDLTAARSGTSWAGGVLWIGAQDQLPRELRLKVSSGREARSIEFVEFRKSRGRETVRRMLVRDLLRRRQGKPDVIEILEADPGAIEPSTFTVEGARAVR